jgi:hypothetical protein
MERCAAIAAGVACLTGPAPLLAAESTTDSPSDGGAEVKREGGDQKASVTVESTGETVTVAQVTDRMVATGMAAGTAVTVAGMAYKDLCRSPCTFEIEPGLYEFMVYGDGVTGASNKFDLRSGPNKLRVEPGSSGVSTGGLWLTALGIVGVVVGVTFMAVGDDVMDFQALPLTLVSGGVTGLGIGMLYWGNTSFEQVGSTGAPATGNATARTPAGLSLRGSM